MSGVSFIEEWSQWFEPCNWYDFHIIHCMFENDEQFGQYEFSFIVLGVGFRLTWVYNPDTKFRQEIMEQVKEITDE